MAEMKRKPERPAIATQIKTATAVKGQEEKLMNRDEDFKEQSAQESRGAPCARCGEYGECTGACGCCGAWRCDRCIDPHYTENDPDYCEVLRMAPDLAGTPTIDLVEVLGPLKLLHETNAAMKIAKG
jgi:hypothetical protein